MTPTSSTSTALTVCMTIIVVIASGDLYLKPSVKHPLVHCPSEGYFSHPRNSRWFYRCVDLYKTGHYRRYYYKCALNEMYVEGSSKCEYNHLQQTKNVSMCPSLSLSNSSFITTIISPNDGHKLNYIEETKNIRPGHSAFQAASHREFLLNSNSIPGRPYPVGPPITNIRKKRFAAEDPITAAIGSDVEKSNMVKPGVNGQPPYGPDSDELCKYIEGLQDDITDDCFIVAAGCSNKRVCGPPGSYFLESQQRVCTVAFKRCLRSERQNINLCRKETLYNPRQFYCMSEKVLCEGSEVIRPPAIPDTTTTTTTTESSTTTRMTTTTTTTTPTSSPTEQLTASFQIHCRYEYEIPSMPEKAMNIHCKIFVLCHANGQFAGIKTLCPKFYQCIKDNYGALYAYLNHCSHPAYYYDHSLAACVLAPPNQCNTGLVRDVLRVLRRKDIDS